MKNVNYLQWLTENTETRWWHDSALPEEIKTAISNGALGVTTNPVLTYRTLQACPDFWKPYIKDIKEDMEPDLRAEEYLKRIATYVAKMLEPIYEKTKGQHGYALGQLDPTKAGNVEGMIKMAERIHGWAKNVAVKLPTTKAGLEVIEELAAKGYTVCTTINFSVAQAIAVGERFQKGVKRAENDGIKKGRCFAVQQVGRVDDYIRDVALDRKIEIKEEDVIQAGLAIAKRSYAIYKEKSYEAEIMPAGLRGFYHLTELAGGKMTFSIHPMVQKFILETDLKQEERIDIPVEKEVIERLMKIDEFKKAYEPDGLKAEEFLTYGLSQKTLSQFAETGWYPLQTYGIKSAPLRWK